MEFLNDKVDVLDLELDGWSEQMHRSVYSQKEYDDIFEELFFKYRGKVKAPPEVRLLMAVGGSALSFHITNSMIKKATVPALAPPEPPARAAVTTPPAMRQQAQAPGAPRREMRPPSFANPFAPPNLPPFGIPVGMAPMQTRESDARPAPPQQQPVQIPIDDDDRLSDVPSELESLPSKMSSLSMDDEVKTVEMTTKKGKKTEKRNASCYLAFRGLANHRCPLAFHHLHRQKHVARVFVPNPSVLDESKRHCQSRTPRN